MSSVEAIKKMIHDREISPCPRMNTDECFYDAFPDEELKPITFDVCVLMRCDKCFFRVFGV